MSDAPPAEPQEPSFIAFVTRHRMIVSFASALLITAGMSWLLWQVLAGYHLERSFVIFRYARNLASGMGFVYNPGEPILIEAASPLYVGMLALGSRWLPDLPLLSHLIGIVSLALGALAMWAIVIDGDHVIAAPLSALLYAGFPILWLSYGLETLPWMALVLLAIACHRRDWSISVAILLGLATLLRPETLIVVVLLIADGVMNDKPLRPIPAIVYGSLVALAAIWAFTTFERGGPLAGFPARAMAAYLPDLLAPTAFEGLFLVIGALLSLSPIWILVGLLAFPALAALRSHRGVLILLAWSIGQVFVLGLLPVAAAAWYFAPLGAALAGLAPIGVDWLRAQLPSTAVKWGAAGVGILIFAGVVGHSLAQYTGEALSAQWMVVQPALAQHNDVEAAAWIADHTAADSMIGTARLGVFGFVSERAIIDYQGRFDTMLFDAIRRGDRSWWVGERTPAYLVLDEDELAEIDAGALRSDPWFAETYAQVNRFDTRPGTEPAVVIYERMREPTPMTGALIGMARLTGGLTLNEIDTDFSLVPLEGGQVGRLRLEWLIEGDAPETPQYVAMQLVGRDDTLAALGGRTIDFSTWPARRLLTTYHSLDIAPGLSPGVYDLQVGIGSDAFNLQWMSVTQAKVPFSSEIFVGGVTGTRADFGEIALLGYRLVRLEETLEVSLMWQAVQAPRVDYQVLIQVRDTNGTIVTQIEVQPHEGNYPTSIWSAGERIPDIYQLDIAGLGPGTYEVYAGLVNANGDRLLTLNGQESVLVGILNIQDTN